MDRRIAGTWHLPMNSQRRVCENNLPSRDYDCAATGNSSRHALPRILKGKPLSQASDYLNEGVRPREVWSWACYDFANSGYTTVVVTAIFNAYFVAVVAGNATWATFAWTAALSVSYCWNIIPMRFAA